MHFEKIKRTAKELQKLCHQLEKLVIRVISIVGWIKLLIDLLFD